ATDRRRSAPATHAAKLAERARIARELHAGASQTQYRIILAASRAHSIGGQKHIDEMQHAIEAVFEACDLGSVGAASDALRCPPALEQRCETCIRACISGGRRTDVQRPGHSAVTGTCVAHLNA